MPLQPGDLLANKYRIEAEIGRGAFGRVYRARDLKLDRVVAIKELVKGADDVGSTLFADYERRFRREAKVQARFNHPNIVHVYELLEEDAGRLYLVMEYVDGESLRDYLARRGPLPIAEAVRIMGEVLAGLAAVHADPLDIVHRDIKPSNVLLTKGGQAKLTDFGLAQVADESMRSGSGGPHPGTPAYMSLEQETTNAYLYPASDVFSAGCVLFELLTGVPYKQARRRRQGLTDLRPDVPAWLADVTTAALAREPDDRPADGAEAAARLAEESKKAADEHVRREQEERAQRAAEEQKRKEAAERARQEAEERARREREEQARREQEERAQRAAEEQKRKEAAERARQEAEAARQRNELVLALAPGVKLALVRVPAGEFLMGSDKGQDPDASGDEQPQHRVYLDEYWIGKYPVTNAQYKAFVDATGHAPPAHWTGGQIPKGKENHPVVYVSWHDAQAFCQWAGLRLPTEAEWEKAARGPSTGSGDGRKYPWGNQPPTEKLCNFDRKVGDTTPVGRYSPAGDSPYGCADMAGNVWEWCADWYDGQYCASSPARNPTGPATGLFRVLRGGSWVNEQGYVRAAVRVRYYPELRGDRLGFRCARSE